MRHRTSERPQRAGSGLAYLLGLIAFSAVAVIAGQDCNWDLQNYHIYAPFALLHWRYTTDVGPGGFQAYLNPLPYLPPYLLRTALPPIGAAIAISALQAVVAPVMWALAGVLSVLAQRPWLRVLATVIGCASATTLSEVGTSFADLPLASMVLGGLLALLRADTPATRREAWLLSLAGLLIGAATGLKLTNGVYACGLGAALLTPWRGWARFAQAAARAALGFFAGFLLTDGVWAYYLWHSLDNPIFPGLNTLFRSTSAAVRDFTDARFRPASFGQALAYPFRIALGGHPTAETSFADPRLALALPLSIVSGLMAWRRGHVQTAVARTMVRAGAFLWASLLAWLFLFAVQRYAVGLEALAGVLLLAYVADLTAPRYRTLACMGVAACVLVVTRPEDWWHRPWTESYVATPPAGLSEPAAFLVVSHPTGYWVPALPQASRFYTLASEGLATGGVLRERVVDGLRTAPGGRVWTLGADVPMEEPVRASMAAMGYAPASPCLRAPSFWWVDTVFCRAVPVGERRLAAADIASDDTVDFSAGGAGWIYEVSGWADAHRAGTATAGSSARLVLRPDPALPVTVLEFAFGAVIHDVRLVVSIDGAISS